MDLILPFKVGDAIESRSFSVGYRGAWFRCKLSDMCTRYGHLECQLEYMDYPDEKKSWTRLFKVPQKCRNQKGSQSREIMVRPPFPQWYWENHIPEHGPWTDVVAIASGPWKVGDLIDWWYTGCFWTGKIVELLGNDRAQIVCPEIPLGEGGCYDVEQKDLRPALDWSLEKGWSVPLSQENGNCWYAVRLITQNPTGSSSSDEASEQSDDGKDEVQKCLNGASHMPDEAVDSHVKPPADTSDKCCMNNRIDGEEQKCMTEASGSSSSDEGTEQSDDGKDEVQKCLNGASHMPDEAVDSHVKPPADTSDKCCMNNRINGEEHKCMIEASGTSLVVIDSKVKHAPDKNDECCTNRQADSPTCSLDNSRQSAQFVTDGQSSPCFKKRKTSTDDASVELADTVCEATMELEKLANKIRGAQDLLLSTGHAPQNTAPAPSWKLLGKNVPAQHE